MPESLKFFHFAVIYFFIIYCFSFCDLRLVKEKRSLVVNYLFLSQASGHPSSTLDVTSIYSGITHSIANTFNSLCGFLAPQLSGLLLVDNVSIPLGIHGGINFCYLVFVLDKNSKQNEPNNKEDNYSSVLMQHEPIKLKVEILSWL